MLDNSGGGFKIRDKNTGLFSTGGFYVGWSKKGKVWSTIGALKCHLAMFNDAIGHGTRRHDPWPYGDHCEVVRLELVESSATPLERPA